MEQKALHVVAGVIRRGGYVLIAKRFPGGPHGGYWEFPGGKVESGEHERDALIRELREELDISVEVEERWGEVIHSYPHATIRLAFYFCDISSGTPRAVGCEKVKWVRSENLHQYPMPEADSEIVNAMSSP
ncbi:MAG: hypothetical protein C0608_03150 [Deltaproteobacteria bacterium]|nr:MAG: hypothetical protein C0608_03150 [Deltaproteobacteria bacterium]